jgi:hypothetical protein
VLVPLLIALKLRSLDREPYEVADGFLKLLLLLPVVHHHERVDCLFPPSHGVTVAQRKRVGQDCSAAASYG